MKPISPNLKFILDAERARPNAPVEASLAAKANLAALLGPSAGLDPAPITHAASGVAKNASRAAVMKLLAVFAIGGALGGGAVAALAPTREHVVYVDRVVAGDAHSATPPPDPTRDLPAPVAPSSLPISASAAPTNPPPAPNPVISTSTALSHDSDLAQERAILERARTALARGDAQASLDAVSEHQRQFPRGQLAEEREAIAVEALVANGRVQEAAERGALFRKTFPNSLLRPIVDQALR